ncbi:hypothetical protein AMTRI_Chr01g102450 [Amborella trichopoda]
MEKSILEAVGVEIIGVMAPVSACMFLVVLLVYNMSSQGSDSTIRTAATLVYLEKSTDSNTQKFEGALLNAGVFVILIALVTFLLVMLYYYRFTCFLKNYMRFSAFFVLGSMGGPIFLSIIEQFSIPIDSITCFILLFNFCVIGVLSVFSGGVPIIVRQVYMVLLGIIVAVWFTKLPEWTTWVILVALALYDLVAVLAPGGPLKMLVDLASSREEELPALIYEARPTISTGSGPRESAMNLLVGGVSESSETMYSQSQSALSVELQPSRSFVQSSDGIGSHRASETCGYSTVTVDGNSSSFGGYGAQKADHGEIEHVNEEMSPLVIRGGESHDLSHATERVEENHERDRAGVHERGRRGEGRILEFEASRGIKLGLGDFIFYSVLVGRAAMYDLLTVYACYIAIISGLGCTLILLSLCNHALPALPVSITLGVMFYFLTRLLMEPFVVGASTNLLMF